MASTVYRTAWASTLEAARMRALRGPIRLAIPVGILSWVGAAAWMGIPEV